MSDYLRTLVSFVPRLVVDWADRGTAKLEEPAEERLRAGALFADVSGFTALTESLAERGADGAEELTRLLNLYFGGLIDLIDRYGGDAVKFAGDAVVALWPAEDDAALAAAVRDIAACALALQARLHDFEVGPGRRLSMKLSIGAGDVRVQHVGGVFDRWEMLLSGPPLGQLGLANDHARPGDIVVAPEALTLLDGAAAGEPRPDGCLRLTGLAGAVLPRERPPLLPQPAAAPILRGFLPGAIRARVDAGQSDWLGELRRVSVAFVNLHGFDVDTPLERAHAAMRAMQMALYRYEGSINKISIDDKGASLLAVLGLPPLAHEDDPERAVRAAAGIRAGLAEQGIDCSVGVTSGLAFCGVIGNARRREYTVMGDVVNLSARLMVAARKMAAACDGVLADHATWLAARGRHPFEILEPITVKGKADPQRIYRPLAVVPGAAGQGAERRRAKLIGRSAERAQFAGRLDRLVAGGPGGVLLLEAEAGMGKGRLLQDLVGQALDRSATALIGSGDAIETATPYRAFRQVLDGLFPAAEMPAEPAARPTWILGRLPDDAELLRWAPLLGDLMDVDWPAGDEIRGLAGRARAERLQALLVRLLARRAAAGPTLLVIKDAHWLDSASLATLLRLVRERPPLLLVLSSRPQAAGPEEWRELVAEPHVESMPLGPMADEDLLALACSRLGVDALPEEVGRLIVGRAEGNPMFAEELALALRDAGLIAVEARACRRTGDGPLDQAPLPHNIEGLLIARIDRLSPDEQLTIKVASVVGRVFDTGLLADIHPIDVHRERIGAHCTNLDRLELTPAMRGGSLLVGQLAGSQYKFKSNLTKEVAYNLMLFSQRRELHQRMAEWLERHADPAQPAVVALLAHHWEHAADVREPDPVFIFKAVGHAATAARMALAGNAEREALAGFRHALALLARLPETAERDRAELPVLLELGAALVNATSWSSPDVQALYARARQLGARTGDHALLFRTVRGEWQDLIGRADYAAAAGRAQEMADLAEAAGDDALRVEANRAIGATRFWVGDFATAAAGLRAALRLYDPDRHAELARTLGQDPEVAIRGILAWAEAFLGRGDEARAQVEAGAARAAALRHPFSRVFAAGAGMWLGFFTDDAEAAARHAAAARDLSLERGFAYLATAAAVVHGWATARLGDAEAGLAETEAAVANWERVGGGIGLPIFLLAHGRALLESGRAGAARERLDDPRLVQRVAVEAWYAADRLGWLAAAHRACGDTAAAAEALAAARNLAAAQGARAVLDRLDATVVPTVAPASRSSAHAD